MPLFAVPPLPPPPALPPMELRVQDEAGAAAQAPEEDHSDYGMGTFELKVRVGFNGNSFNPISLLGAFLGWTEFQAVAGFGFLEIGDLSFGIGGEVFYSRPWFIELLSQAVVSAATDSTFNWKLEEYGFAGRGEVHFTGLDGIDPYGVLLLGPTQTVLNVSLETQDGVATGKFTSGGLRIGMGAGANVVSKGGLVAGAELRYLAGLRFRETASVSVTDSEGDEVDVFEMTGAQSPPRGFSWMIFAGYRL